VQVGGVNAFESCQFNDGTGDGIICAGAAFVGCKFYRNSLAAIDASAACFAFFCEFFSNGSQAIDGAPSNDSFLIAVNCTIDGDAKDTTIGIEKNVSFHGIVIAVNNIVYDCATGMQWGPGGTSNAEFGISLNNLLNSNTANYGNGAFTSAGEVTSAPGFTNEGTNDYSLAGGSAAKEAGFDQQNNSDIGAHSTAAAGGGGLLVHPGTSGGARG
jgi:hypothetical protein